MTGCRSPRGRKRCRELSSLNKDDSSRHLFLPPWGEDSRSGDGRPEVISRSALAGRRVEFGLEEGATPEPLSLSEAALALFRLLVEGQGRIEVNDPTGEPYRELARAGLMRAGSTFRDGEESIYCLT